MPSPRSPAALQSSEPAALSGACWNIPLSPLGWLQGLPSIRVPGVLLQDLSRGSPPLSLHSVGSPALQASSVNYYFGRGLSSAQLQGAGFCPLLAPPSWPGTPPPPRVAASPTRGGLVQTHPPLGTLGGC